MPNNNDSNTNELALAQAKLEVLNFFMTGNNMHSLTAHLENMFLSAVCDNETDGESRANFAYLYSELKGLFTKLEAFKTAGKNRV